ncbi:coenzyme F420-0:L-glutamate ligase [Candidatus Peregrinibacteria bacterium]|nr:coenzyme F420-0:L-glutamate ligase [Candidatus Peregrinibacteria bacterium]
MDLKKHPLSYWISKEADRVFDKNEDITLTLKDNCLIPNAGIDLSNAPQDAAILWPKDAFKTAQEIQKRLRRHFKIRRLGILIADSTCQPLRAGTTGRAIGWAGFEGVEDQRGKKDLYGKTMRVTQKAVADNLASALLLGVGETNEQTPFVLFRGAPVKFTEKKATKKTAFFPPSACIFRSVYSREFLKQPL